MKVRHPFLSPTITTTAPQDIARQDAASFEVYRQLRDDIVSCRLKPDERLRFETLRNVYGAGIGTLREALSHLVSDGLVRTEAGRGFRVAPVSVADLTDITDWRVEFEVRAITQSILKGDEAWESEIVISYHLLAKTELPAYDAPPEEWLNYGARHKRFHTALVAACGSPWLLHFRNLLFDQARRYQALAVVRPRPKVYRNDDEHREIMQVVLDREAERAAELIEQHIRRTSDAVLKELTTLSAQEQPDIPAAPVKAGSRKRAAIAPEAKPVAEAGPAKLPRKPKVVKAAT